MLNFAFFFFQNTASLWGYLIEEQKHECQHNVKKLPYSTILLFSADCLLVEAIDVLLFDGRDALCYLGIRQKAKEYIACSRGRHDVFMPRLVTSKTYPSLPLAVNNWPLSKTFSCNTAVKNRITLVLFFTESCNFKGQTIFSLGKDPLFLLL